MSRTNTLTPSGIVRAHGEQWPSAESCEELINLRYRHNTLRPCGTKKSLMRGSNAEADNNFERVLIHRMPSHKNYIGVNRKSAYLYIRWFDITTGATQQVVRQMDADDLVDIKFINNLLILSSYNGKIIYTYAFVNNTYKSIYGGVLPDIRFQIDKYALEVANFENDGIRTKYQELPIRNASVYVEDVIAGMNYLRHKHDYKKSEGYVFVCFNLTLFDGSETKPTQPVMVRLGSGLEIDYGSQIAPSAVDLLWIRLGVEKLRVRLESISGFNYSAMKDIIKEINVYCTYPKSYYDIEKTYKETEQAIITSYMNDYIEEAILPQKAIEIRDGSIKYYDNSGALGGEGLKRQNSFAFAKTEAKDAADQLFYRQKSIPLQSSIAEMQEWIELDFSEAMLTGKTMSVDNSGHIRRWGYMATYNSRLHLFNTINRLVIPDTLYFAQSWAYTGAYSALVNGLNAKFSVPEADSFTADSAEVTMRLYTSTDTKDLVSIRRFTTKLAWYGSYVCLALKSIPTVLDARTYRCDIYFAFGGSTYKYSFSLTASKSYDFSYVSIPSLSIGSNIPNVSTEWAVIDMSGKTTYESIPPYDPLLTNDDTFYNEGDVVTVSAQNNPIFFDVHNSYRIGGNIIAMSPSSTGISDVQIGQYPMMVFTDNGIYAMQVGDTKVVYTAVVKVAEDIAASAEIRATRYGIVFLSNDGVYLLYGRTCTRLSMPLDGYPDLHIRDCVQFSAAVGSPDLYNILPYLSGDFRAEITQINDIYGGVFVRNTTLSYDASRDEVIVSPHNKPYSYVYDFVTKTWHKITQTFVQHDGDIAITLANSVYTVRDMMEEDYTGGVIVHLQTRTNKLESEGYKTAYRTIARVNINCGTTAQEANYVFSMYLLASRDMRNWTMIGLHQQKGYTDIMRILKTSGSFKYFVLMMGGKVSQHSEITYANIEVIDRYTNKAR